MKNLQILAIMSVAFAYIQLDAKPSIINQIAEQPATSFVDAARNIQSTVDILENLEKINPTVIERIILDEKNLEANFSSIKTFVHKKIKELKNLAQEKIIDEADFARLAVELADAQAAFEKACARYKAQYKKAFKGSQAIMDSLMEAEQSLKNLSAQQIKQELNQTSQYVKETMQDAITKVKESDAGKAVVKGLEQGRQYLDAFSNYMTSSDDNDLSDEVDIQYYKNLEEFA